MNTSTAINDQIAVHFGDERRPEVFKRLEENLPMLDAMWSQYQAVMAGGEIDIPTKELIGLSVAIVKPNEYVIGLQQRRVRQAGVDLVGEQEAFAVAAFFESFGSFARALGVEADLHPRKQLADGDGGPTGQGTYANVTYVNSPADANVSEVYDDIKSVMGISFVPNIFKAMGHQPAALKAKWNCYKAIMFEGTLPRLTKELIAISVSAVGGCNYCACAHSAASRQLGLSEQGLVEVASVVDLFVCLCSLAKGFRLGKRNL